MSMLKAATIRHAASLGNLGAFRRDVNTTELPTLPIWDNNDLFDALKLSYETEPQLDTNPSPIVSSPVNDAASLSSFPLDLSEILNSLVGECGFLPSVQPSSSTPVPDFNTLLPDQAPQATDAEIEASLSLPDAASLLPGANIDSDADLANLVFGTSQSNVLGSPAVISPSAPTDAAPAAPAVPTVPGMPEATNPWLSPDFSLGANALSNENPTAPVDSSILNPNLLDVNQITPEDISAVVAASLASPPAAPAPPVISPDLLLPNATATTSPTSLGPSLPNPSNPFITPDLTNPLAPPFDLTNPLNLISPDIFTDINLAPPTTPSRAPVSSHYTQGSRPLNLPTQDTPPSSPSPLPTTPPTPSPTMASSPKTPTKKDSGRELMWVNFSPCDGAKLSAGVAPSGGRGTKGKKREAGEMTPSKSKRRR